MVNYMVATVGVLAAVNSAQVRAAEQVVLNSSIQETDTLEFRIDKTPFEDINREFIHTANFRTPITRTENPDYRVPRRLDKGNPATLAHPGREYAMRLYGKDNRN